MSNTDTQPRMVLEAIRREKNIIERRIAELQKRKAVLEQWLEEDETDDERRGERQKQLQDKRT